MQEFIRERFNLDPIAFTLASNQDHFTPVTGAPVGQYYISKNGMTFVNGSGSIYEVDNGFYSLTMGTDEQDAYTRVISIPGLSGISGYDPVFLRVNGGPQLEVVTTSQGQTYPMTFAMLSDIDHVSPIPGLSPAVRISRDGSGFVASDYPAIDIGRGCYCVNVLTYGETPTGEHNNECVYLIEASASGADTTYDKFQVFRHDYPA